MTNARTAKPVRAAYFAAIGAGIVCVGLIATVAWGALRPVEEISRQAEVMAADKDPEAAALAARAVTANPVDARAIKVLGVLADRAGKPQKALELMTLSDKVSRRDAYTQTWLMQHDLQTGNYAQALVRADALLRVYPEAGKILIPALTTIATDSRGAAAISGQLSTLPPWRSSFLAVLAEKADPTVTFSVLSQLNAGPAKPVDGEIAGYLGRLMALKQYDQAFLGWLLFMPQERLSAFRGVYDGDFDNLPGPQPFHWVLAGGVGGRVDIRPSASRPHDQALQVSYDGFSTPTLVYQWMVLPPGPQRLSMDALYDTPEAQNRLIWQVTCADSGAPLLQMKPQANGTWRHFSQTFTVPPTGCGAQQLILLPKAGDHTTSLSVWYDKLAVEPDTSGAG